VSVLLSRADISNSRLFGCSSASRSNMMGAQCSVAAVLLSTGLCNACALGCMH
jgi:hypothetical protein